MRKFYGFSGLVALLLCLCLVACNEQPTGTPKNGTTLDYASFVQKLKQHGAIVTTTDRATNSTLLSGSSYGIIVDKEHISVFEYKTVSDVQTDAGRISPGGDYISNSNGQGMAILDWVTTPHFYKAGRIIVLYVGRNQSIITLLKSLLGPQFAGGN